MAALSGLGQQQTAFSINLGEMKLKKQYQDEMLRQMTIDNLLQYLQSSYEKRHAEKEAQRRRNQSLGIKAATIGGAALAGPLVGALGAGAAPAVGTAASGAGDFFSTAAGGAMYA